MIFFEHAFSGLTLDLGGGAEGVILHLYPAGSIAVDKKLEEILEVPAPLKAQ
ncbi:MAG: hypothetical protein VB108_02940 [Anaerolineaceae bacterium]|nr:hypothetical protein [Anaerolineaceae bacterium]